MTIFCFLQCTLYKIDELLHTGKSNALNNRSDSTPRTLTLPVWLVLISIVPAVSCTLLQPFLRPEFMDFFFFFKNVYCIYFRIKLHTQSLKFGCFLYSFLGFFFDIFFNVWKSKRGNAISQFQIHGSSHWYTVCGIFWQKTTKFLRIVI